MAGKTDFMYSAKIEEVPSVELRDWLFDDVVVTLWESRPVFEMVREEGAEKESEQVVIDPETELPKVEIINKGILKLNFYDWIKKAPENPTYASS